jgi:hypothetical protein
VFASRTAKTGEPLAAALRNVRMREHSDPRKLDQLAPFAGACFAGHALAAECRIRQEAV